MIKGEIIIKIFNKSYFNMSFVIKEITDKSQWENFVLGQGPDTFLQSWNWGEFNVAMGNKIWRLGIFDNQNLICVALIIKVIAKRGTFLFCPHGPIFESLKFKVQSSELLNELFMYLKELAKEEKVDFVRVGPLLENIPENLRIFKDYGFRDAPIHMMHPETGWLVDITKSEEEILKGMRKTTRNLIRRGEREGIKVTQSTNIADLDIFYCIHQETVNRHGFIPFSYEYLKTELEIFEKDDQIKIFLALYNNRILSGAIIVFYGQSAYYHHGASVISKIPSSYFLLWQAIKEAKRRGAKTFDFWGIVKDNPKHPWTGLSLFKTGFGGYKSQYLHCQDFVVTPGYWLNYLVEKIRRIKRGY